MDEKAQDVGVAPEPLASPGEPPEVALWRRRNRALADGDLDLCHDTHLAECDGCGQERGVRVLRHGPAITPAPSHTHTSMRRGKRLCSACHWMRARPPMKIKECLFPGWPSCAIRKGDGEAAPGRLNVSPEHYALVFTTRVQ